MTPGRAGLLAVALAVPLSASDAHPPDDPATPAVPVEQRGIAVGTAAPTFRARDQSGRWQDLSTLSGPDGLVLLFVRSADW